MISFFFFFNDTATTEIYTLSLHDALPIWRRCIGRRCVGRHGPARSGKAGSVRSEEHTSELQSQSNLVCRLLLEKKKKNNIHYLNHDNHAFANCSLTYTSRDRLLLMSDPVQ